MEEWEKQMLMMLVQWEVGDVNEEQTVAAIWTILNSQAERTGSIKGLLLSDKYHASARIKVAASGGDPFNLDELKDAVLDSSLTGKEIVDAAWGRLGVSNTTSRLVNEVLDAYNNGGEDLTKGGKYFVHVWGTVADWYKEGIEAIAVDQGVGDQIYVYHIPGDPGRKDLIVNNLIAPPYEERIEALEVNNSQ